MMKKLINLTLSLVSIVGMFGLYVTYGATPAAAAWNDCPVGLLCAWNGAGGSGAMWTFPISQYPQNFCNVVPPNKGPMQWTSVWNRYGSGLRVNIYNQSNCVLGTAVTIQNNQKVNLADLGFDNRDLAFRSF